MSAAGWFIMLASCLGMTGFFVWGIVRILSSPEASERVHGTSDIDPGDGEE